LKTYLLPLKVENVKHTKLKENVEMKREKEGGKGRKRTGITGTGF
jgi:hypothetical protein